MPHYDYQCIDEECNHIFEVSLGVYELDNVEIKCPKCKKICKRNVSGGTGILFKGDGWAADGYSDKIEVKDNKGNK